MNLIYVSANFSFFFISLFIFHLGRYQAKTNMKTKTKIPQETSIYTRYLHQHDGMNISNIVRQYTQYTSIYRHCTRKTKKLNSKNDRKIIWKIQRFQEQFGYTFTANRVKYDHRVAI